jgi:hypothetical protein
MSAFAGLRHVGDDARRTRSAHPRATRDARTQERAA